GSVLGSITEGAAAAPVKASAAAKTQLAGGAVSQPVGSPSAPTRLIGTPPQAPPSRPPASQSAPTRLEPPTRLATSAALAPAPSPGPGRVPRPAPRAVGPQADGREGPPSRRRARLGQTRSNPQGGRAGGRAAAGVSRART